MSGKRNKKIRNSFFETHPQQVEIMEKTAAKLDKKYAGSEYRPTIRDAKKIFFKHLRKEYQKFKREWAA